MKDHWRPHTTRLPKKVPPTERNMRRGFSFRKAFRWRESFLFVHLKAEVRISVTHRAIAGAYINGVMSFNEWRCQDDNEYTRAQCWHQRDLVHHQTIWNGCFKPYVSRYTHCTSRPCTIKYSASRLILKGSAWPFSVAFLEMSIQPRRWNATQRTLAIASCPNLLLKPTLTFQALQAPSCIDVVFAPWVSSFPIRVLHPIRRLKCRWKTASFQLIMFFTIRQEYGAALAFIVMCFLQNWKSCLLANRLQNLTRGHKGQRHVCELRRLPYLNSSTETVAAARSRRCAGHRLQKGALGRSWVLACPRLTAACWNNNNYKC